MTRWSLVVSSRAESDAALEELCRLYWSPLYLYCRRSGLSIEDAEDVTQRFFHDLLKARHDLLADASPDAGRLRTLFLRVMQRRIADHHRHASREKRGGGQVVSLDTEAAEAGLRALCREATPEQVFDRQWALSVLHLSLTRLERDYADAGRELHFKSLVPFLGLSGGEPDYHQVQQVLGLSETSARKAVQRFRDRFRRHLRAEIAETIAGSDETAIDRELEELRAALR